VTAVSDDEVLNLETELRAFFIFAGHCSLVSDTDVPGEFRPRAFFFWSEAERV
jgi:hypothetical protein